MVDFTSLFEMGRGVSPPTKHQIQIVKDMFVPEQIKTQETFGTCYKIAVHKCF